MTSWTVLPVQPWVLPTITTDLPQNSLAVDIIKNRYSNLALADPSFHLTSPIDMLLGGDVYGSIMDGRTGLGCRRVDRQYITDYPIPTAFSSMFEWILVGPVPVAQIVIVNRCRFLRPRPLSG